MDLVLANRPGADLSILRTLTAEERGLVLSHYTRQDEDAATAAMLERWWRAKHWIACDCRAARSARPLLYVRRTFRGQHVLARMGERRVHAPNCPLAATPARASAAETRAPVLPKLPSLLFRWISAARLNVLYPYRAADIAEAQWGSLKEAAKQIDIETGRTLFDYSRTHAKGLNDLFARLATRGPKGESWAVFLSVVERVSLEEWRNAFLYQDTGLTVEEVRRWGEPKFESFGALVCEAGPYMLLTEFVCDASLKRPRARTVFAHPVYSRKHLIPVDGADERRTLRVLIEMQFAWMSESQTALCIRKTLPGTAVHDRGVSFQLQRMRPNGLPEDAWDVVSAQGSDPTRSPRPGDAIYHWLDPGAPGNADEQFRSDLIASTAASQVGTERSGDAPEIERSRAGEVRLAAGEQTY
jgi:hypothetical protein